MRFCFVTYDIMNRKLQHGQQCFEDTCNYIMKRKTCLHDGIVTTNLDKNGLVEIPPGRGEPDDGLTKIWKHLEHSHHAKNAKCEVHISGLNHDCSSNLHTNNPCWIIGSAAIQ